MQRKKRYVKGTYRASLNLDSSYYLTSITNTDGSVQYFRLRDITEESIYHVKAHCT